MTATLTAPASPSPAALTRDELAEMFRSQRGATFATLTVQTTKKLLKKNRYTGEPQPCRSIVKVSRVNVCLGHDYENSVNRSRLRRGAEADFEAQGLPDWQEHAGGPLRRHKASGKLYVAVKVENVYTTSYLSPAGELLDADELAGYLPKASKGEIAHVTYGLDTIGSVVMHGRSYTVA
ncbi:MAG: hypothetical protein AAF593_00300 [Planctomycetota bacterium]